MSVSHVEIAMPDGTARALLAQPPGGGNGPPVLFFMDAMGLRPALEEMVGRIAAEGYTVLAPDVFYRSQPYGPFDPKTIFSDKEALKALGRMNRAFANALFEQDSRYYIDAARKHAGEGAVRTVGYCMGGRCALMLAGHHPDEVSAAASFHGGELAPDKEDSPHRLADRMKAKIYIGVAETDAFFEGEEEARLAGALRGGRVNHVIETFPGTQHGFAVPDLPVFDQRAADSHWDRLFTLFRLD
ncbi:MAG: dienelactone hydrolase family protein [Sphingobium sp.]